MILVPIFWNSLWGQTCQKCPEAICPGNSEVHGLWDQNTTFRPTSQELQFYRVRSCFPIPSTMTYDFMKNELWFGLNECDCSFI